MKTNVIHNQDCIEGMSELPDKSIDTIITDPPYGLSFMGKEWDNFTDNEALQKWTKQWSKEALRIAKPGTIMLTFGGTRTWHKIACGIEDAGWEIRDTLMWVYGSGFPKSHNIGKAVDKKLGNERKDLGESPNNRDRTKHNYNSVGNVGSNAKITKGNTKWEGYGTALKPAWEPIIMAMKPYENTYAKNALKYDVAGLNIDGARVGLNNEENPTGSGNRNAKGNVYELKDWESKNGGNVTPDKGRFPANLIHDGSEEVEACFPHTENGGQNKTSQKGFQDEYVGGKANKKNINSTKFAGDQGFASRYFKRIKYSSKASKKERNKGLEEFEEKDKKRFGSGGRTKVNGEWRETHSERKPFKNNHPTVKPLALMKYLVELTKMPNKDQIYLDPFIGSGTTGMAVRRKNRNYIGFEKEEEYVTIARARVKSIEQELI